MPIAPSSAVGMGIPMGSPRVWVWGGYVDRNSVPTAALDSAVGTGIPMGIPLGIGYGDRNSDSTAALASSQYVRGRTIDDAAKRC